MVTGRHRALLDIVIDADDKASKKLDRIGGSFRKFGDVAKKALLIGGAAIVAGAGLAVLGSKVFSAGAQLELLDKKAQTVFGEALPAITKAAEENAAAMGLTESQYRDAAAALGDLLIPMQFTREQAAGMSADLIGVSGALSEWSGGQRSATEVGRILAKAMLGEREQLKELGISITEADVQGRLLTKGQKDLTGAALAQAKALATQELIFEKSTDAQAAFADGAGNAFRSQQRLKAAVGEVKEVMLRALMPAMARAADLVSQRVVPAVIRLAAWLEVKIPQAAAAMGRAWERVLPFVEAFVRGFDLLLNVSKRVFEFIVKNKPVLVAAIVAIGVAIALALGPASLAVVAIVAIVTLVGKLRDSWRSAANGVIGAVEAMANGVIGGMNKVVEGITNAIEFGLNPLLGLAAKFGVGPGKVDFGSEFIGNVAIPRFRDLGAAARIIEDEFAEMSRGVALSGDTFTAAVPPALALSNALDGVTTSAKAAAAATSTSAPVDRLASLGEAGMSNRLAAIREFGAGGFGFNVQGRRAGTGRNVGIGGAFATFGEAEAAVRRDGSGQGLSPIEIENLVGQLRTQAVAQGVTVTIVNQIEGSLVTQAEVDEASVSAVGAAAAAGAFRGTHLDPALV